jgi:hypothetical protein
VRPLTLVVSISLFAGAAAAQSAAKTSAARPVPPLKRAATPTTAPITAVDLMSRIYPYADDSMLGREAGTVWNVKATAFIADEARKLGLEPAGDSGTFFQAIPLIERVLDSTAIVSLGAAPLVVGKDYVARDQGGPMRSIDRVPVVYAGAWGDSVLLAPEQAAGKLVLVGAPRQPPQGAPNWFVPRAQVTRRYRDAAGIGLLTFDLMPPDVLGQLAATSVTLKQEASAPGQVRGVLPSYLYFSQAAARAILGVNPDSAAVGKTGQPLAGTPLFVERTKPARNVIAILPGADSALQGQLVALGAHNDHVGFNREPVDHDSLRAFNTAARALQIQSPAPPLAESRRAQIRVNVDSLRRLRPVRLDSIYNGADDDASGSMALLEIAESFARGSAKPRRSLLFVWHTAEEMGLFGAQYFTEHPTVPRDSIVAQLNMDMIGRGGRGEEALGGPRYLQLIGSRRLSTELGDLVEQVNRRQTPPFAIDYQYDAAGHPEQYYCRSDHYMYARYGIPVAFFSTGDHQDYHQVTDEPQYLDYEHLRRVTQLIHDVTAAVANLEHRVVVDQPKPDPHGQCQQ